MREILQIHPLDTVAVALQPLMAKSEISFGGQHIVLADNIPAGHKVALRDIREGEDIIKYGFPIGHAKQDITAGQLVDHNNVKTNLETASSLPSCKDEDFPLPTGRRGDDGVSFLGYQRPDGQVGIRNDIWVIPTVGCVNGICRQIVERVRAEIQDKIVDGEEYNEVEINYFPHNYGCSQLGDDHENTRKILRDMVLHPNAGGVLVVGLGCENNQPREFEMLLGDYNRQRIRFMICQEVEGDEVEAGLRLVRELFTQARTDSRVRVPFNKLHIGLKCGGSDGFSGITANPLLGAFTDWLCKEQGGTAILTEVPEMFGAEQLLIQRAVSSQVREQICHLIDDFKDYFRSHGQPVGENPSPGNKAGGISTLEEKALGCTQKGGTVPVVGVLEYGERLEKREKSSEVRDGLYLLSAPGNDLVASTALAAAGCQLVLFTTGRGTPFSTFVPTMKVSSNSDLACRKPQWIDFDAGALLNGTSMNELLQRFINCVIDVASGRTRTAAEVHGNAEFAIFKNGVTL